MLLNVTKGIRFGQSLKRKRGYLGELGINGKIILEWILKK
jgi:hypothetical protein